MATGSRMTRAITMGLMASIIGMAEAQAGGPIQVEDAEVELSTAAQLIEDLQASADRVVDIAQQAATYATLVETYVNAGLNTIALPAQVFARAQGYYTRVEGLVTAAGTIVGGEGGTMWQRGRELRYVARGAGGVPGEAGRTFRNIRDQITRQQDENAELLGMNDERKKANGELATAAKESSETAIGRMAASQASAQVSAAHLAATQQTNDLLQQQIYNQMVKDSAEIAADEVYQQELTASFDQQKAMAASPAFMTRSPATWGR